MIEDHQRWLGYLQPDGLVVSPAALVDSGAVLDNDTRPLQQRLLEHLRLEQSWDGESEPLLHDLPVFLTDFLGWQESDFLSGDAIPQDLTSFLPAFQETLSPTHAVADPDEAGKYLLLIQETAAPDLDLPDPAETSTWQASPAARFERLLRDTRVPIGLLANATHLRLIYAPPGENPGSLTFPLAGMTEVPGRPVLAGFHLLLSAFRLFQCPANETLPALLKKSRDYQANVSTALASQVLASLYELHRGLLAAHAKSGKTLLTVALEKNPEAIYGAQLNVLMRLVFLLFAEDRALMPDSTLYLRNYSIHQLYIQLREDHELYPDTMDLRYGAWARLLSVFRMVHSGCDHPDLKIPARAGYLFDPARYPFLEARDHSGALPDTGLPKVPDSTIHRILRNLLYLKGEKLSYRTLDVEQIGSVYENIIGFQVRTSPGLTIALKPKKSHGAPVHIDLDSLLAAKPADRTKRLVELADTKLPAASDKLLKTAATTHDLLAALEKRIDRRATTHALPPGSIILQPTDERRRSGSHYTPRSFTQPIVRKTLEPILDRLGRHPLPETLLDLKVADIAVGSAAFLVETCRQLGRELVSAWEYHKSTPRIPPDEDTERHAMRLIAQRCLYGVDSNPMAVDLAKLSLWLATMAKDHPFTFLDHAIKSGDSLVGLTNEQIAAFHWDPSKAQDRQLGQQEIEKLLPALLKLRLEILDETEDTPFAFLRKEAKLGEIANLTSQVKTTADLIIAAFFAGEKPKQRQQNRDEFLHNILEIRKGDARLLPWLTESLKELRGGQYPISPFHWELEFPEVFSRGNPGFDGIVGNPPFLGGKRISTVAGDAYLDLLLETFTGSHGNSDLVAFFFRHAFRLIRKRGTFGLIATNTIAQGDTRSTGLRMITNDSGEIYAAASRKKWPGEAAVMVSLVYVVKGNFEGMRILNDKNVQLITAYLFHVGENEDPFRLKENEGLCFLGFKVYGQGFLFDDSDSKSNPLSEMHRIIAEDPSSRDLIMPFLGGEELNDSPTQQPRRFAINFDDRTEEDAQGWPELFEIVRSKVKPARDKLKRKALRDKWWQFGERQPGLLAAMHDLDSVLVCCQTSKFRTFALCSSDFVFSHKTVVICSESLGILSVVHSRFHEVWALFFGSSLEDRPVYTGSDCFETFPFPRTGESDGALEEAGKTYYEFRAELMVRNNEGLTKTYNRFHDPEEESPDILRLRELHSAMDRAVLDAYGWTEIPTACEFLLDYEEDDESSEPGKRPAKRKSPGATAGPTTSATKSSPNSSP